ncbi:MAG TPA: hypothetical protein VEC36_03775 [Patescibacteria group bacterium]|nr:hypothetical protein [Patescibacteria group bacterium]
MKKIFAFALMLMTAASLTVEAGNGNGKGKHKGKKVKKHKSQTVRVVTVPTQTIYVAPTAFVVRNGVTYYNGFTVTTTSAGERYYVNSKGNKIMIKVK